MKLIPLDIIEQALSAQGITGLNRAAEKDVMSVTEFLELLSSGLCYDIIPADARMDYRENGD